jgi:hypothetical protein
MINKVSHKSTDLTSKLFEYFGGEMNLARIKFFGLFITALCKVQTVCFEKLSCAFDSPAQSNSSLRRIQRFMAEYALDSDLIARFVFALLPHKPPYTIAMDRTNWKFGETNINALVIAIVYDGLAFPVLYKLMDKRGNSHTKERIDIIDRFIRLFGRKAMKNLVADREFVGEEWMEYLNFQEIEYHIRIRDNFLVKDPRTGKEIKAWWMFNDLRINECRVLYRIYYVNNQLCYLSASKIKNKEGKPELQVLISFNNPLQAQELYSGRWQIETAFRALKSSGFNIEDTHLTNLDRIEKLFSIVTVAFTWAYLDGIHLHRNVKPIRMLKHGNKAKSLLKYGLQAIAAVLLNPINRSEIDIYQFLSCT